LKANKPLYAVLYKDSATNNHEKCQGNAFLVKQGAKYISGSENLNAVSESILNYKPIKTNLFD
jgi:hypothetical protein